MAKKKTTKCNTVCRHLKTVVAVLLLTMLMTVAAAATSSTTPPDMRCSVDNGLAADDTDCGRFLVCLQGKVRRMDCSKDLLFNQHKLVCDYPSNVQCGARPLEPESYERCFASMVNVTIRAVNQVKAPQFEAAVIVKAPRQALRYILLMAAGLNPMFRFETQNFQGYGDYVSSLNDVRNDISKDLAIWTPYGKGQVIRDSIDDYYPENNEPITYMYTEGLG